MFSRLISLTRKGWGKLCLIYFTAVLFALLIYTSFTCEHMTKREVAWWWAFIVVLIFVISMLITLFVLLILSDYFYFELSQNTTTGVGTLQTEPPATPEVSTLKTVTTIPSVSTTNQPDTQQGQFVNLTPQGKAPVTVVDMRDKSKSRPKERESSKTKRSNWNTNS